MNNDSNRRPGAWPRRDPLTGLLLCERCWNGLHDAGCLEGGCGCGCAHELAPPRRRMAKPKKLEKLGQTAFDVGTITIRADS